MSRPHFRVLCPFSRPMVNRDVALPPALMNTKGPQLNERNKSAIIRIIYTGFLLKLSIGIRYPWSFFEISVGSNASESKLKAIALNHVNMQCSKHAFLCFTGHERESQSDSGTSLRRQEPLPPPQTISNGNADDNATVGIHGRANDDPNWKYPFDAQGGQTPPPPRLYA